MSKCKLVLLAMVPALLLLGGCGSSQVVIPEEKAAPKKSAEDLVEDKLGELAERIRKLPAYKPDEIIRQTEMLNKINEAKLLTTKIDPVTRKVPLYVTEDIEKKIREIEADYKKMAPAKQ